MDCDVTNPSEGQRRLRRLTGTHLTVIIVAALLTLVPGAAFAVVSATHTEIVDPASGQQAYVTNHQLNVRGVVGTGDVVPKSAFAITRNVSVDPGQKLDYRQLLINNPYAETLAVNEISLTGYNPAAPNITLFVESFPVAQSCPTDPPTPSTGILWHGGLENAQAAGAWTFPTPVEVHPGIQSRSCLYAAISGYSDGATISIVGLRGVER